MRVISTGKCPHSVNTAAREQIWILTAAKIWNPFFDSLCCFNSTGFFYIALCRNFFLNNPFFSEVTAVWMSYVPLQGQSEERPEATGSGCKHGPMECERRSEPQAHSSDSNGRPAWHQRRPTTGTTEDTAKVRPDSRSCKIHVHSYAELAALDVCQSNYSRDVGFERLVDLSCLFFGRFQVQFLAERPFIPPDVSRRFPNSLKRVSDNRIQIGSYHFFPLPFQVVIYKPVRSRTHNCKVQVIEGQKILIGGE